MPLDTRRWLQVKTLIIDEISMLDGRYFDQLEKLARRLRGSRLPFGGIQLILVRSPRLPLGMLPVRSPPKGPPSPLTLRPRSDVGGRFPAASSGDAPRRGACLCVSGRQLGPLCPALRRAQGGAPGENGLGTEGAPGRACFTLAPARASRSHTLTRPFLFRFIARPTPSLRVCCGASAWESAPTRTLS